MTTYNILKENVNIEDVIKEVGEADLTSLLSFGELLRPLSLNAKAFVLDAAIQTGITTAQDEISIIISIMTDRITKKGSKEDIQDVLVHVNKILTDAVNVRLNDREVKH